MSSVFDGYERQYCELSANLSKILADLPGLGKDEYKAKLKEVEAGLVEAESLTRRMDLEARSLAPAQKASLLAKIRELKSDLAQLKKDFKAAPPEPPLGGAAADAVNGDAARRELLHGETDGRSDEYGASAAHGAKLLSQEHRMHQSSERLEQSRRMLVETEELGVSVLEELNQQRQTLLNTRDRLHGVDDSIAKARQILNNMLRNANRNRWIAAAVILILLAAIILVIAIKLRGHNS